MVIFQLGINTLDPSNQNLSKLKKEDLQLPETYLQMPFTWHLELETEPPMIII